MQSLLSIFLRLCIYGSFIIWIVGMHPVRFIFARAVPLSQSDISRALQNIKGWRIEEKDENVIYRDFEFRDFKQAMLFMNAVADVCEAVGHHPSWTNTYNKVHVRLTTHDAGNRVTQRDLNLAERMNDIFTRNL
ncbi:pterin-4-alpha-carbinolamine dehydratase [Trypanosoma theileri]|uniref:4a-hydroxytetrahydrobiopterin dehydratase n=1 Tax=Trypanosoma theileri TaxID=67003 RepID=A0A1X0NV87_9TRYP|nr:pterin-4-alpha-carbinolamine dehydratase [Trypanosoma theileri]ORC88595.1 pterin-4-alpha-carbinolamine dehydratase [Trypanosoma theileri]